jgi:hypothetical protein
LKQSLRKRLQENHNPIISAGAGICLPLQITLNANSTKKRRVRIIVITSRENENSKQEDRALRLFQSPKKPYHFHRKKKHKAPANHPWRQYRVSTNNAGK